MLIAVTDAYHNTHAYYADRDKGKRRSRAREYELARDWERAATLVQKYDDRLAMRLGLKSTYWREGAVWTQAQIKEAGIGLERVRVEAMSMFQDTRQMKKNG